MLISFSTGSMTEALRQKSSAVQLTDEAPLLSRPQFPTTASYTQPNENHQNLSASGTTAATPEAPIYPAPPTTVVVSIKSPYQPIPCGKPSNLIGSACATGCGIGGGVIGYLCCGLWGLFATAGGAALGGYCGKETTKSCDPRKGEVVRMYRGT